MKCNTPYAARSPVSPVVLDTLLNFHMLDQCIQRFRQLLVYVEKLLDTRMQASGSSLHVGQPAPRSSTIVSSMSRAIGPVDQPRHHSGSSTRHSMTRVIVSLNVDRRVDQTLIGARTH